MSIKLQREDKYRSRQKARYRIKQHKGIYARMAELLWNSGNGNTKKAIGLLQEVIYYIIS